ncbi:hypothetical protein Vafri_6628 [Volvox africanus]|uniref:Uncharacterized protein n=1 Tax=Volvox africanus TaxID=51714 RepID=A0A8J4B2P9_9CHLO|nr:hypothetical protein Vafri_6628 [Volvox africanus]
MVAILVPAGLAPLGSVSKGLGALSSVCGLPAIALPAACSSESVLPQAREPVQQRARRGTLLIEVRGATKAPPRTGTRASASRFLEFVVSKPKLRKRRRGKGDDGSGSDSGGDDGFGGSGGGGWRGGSFNGGFGDHGGYSGGEYFSNWLMYEGAWLWPAIVAASVLHSLGYCVLATDDARRSQLRSRTVGSVP